VRNTFEKIINCQATRLAAARGEGLTNDELMKLTVADVREGLGMEI
ncbi:MAG: AAA family ATPase, partial [Firmicutes bacterium]|nr:AAA family ATPase [Bacillota bacterium]